MKKSIILFCVALLLPSTLRAQVFPVPLKPDAEVKKAQNLPAGITASVEDKMLTFTAEAGHKNGSWTTELAMPPKKMGKSVIVSVKYKLELADETANQMPPFVFECGGKKLHIRRPENGGDEDSEWTVGKTRLRLPFSGKVPFSIRFRKGEGKLIIHSISADNGKKEEPENGKKEKEKK